MVSSSTKAKHGVAMWRAIASIAPSAILTATWLHAFVRTQMFGEIRPQGQSLKEVLFDPLSFIFFRRPAGRKKTHSENT